MRLPNRSLLGQQYALPCAVGCSVISVTHTLLGSAAVKSRRTWSSLTAGLGVLTAAGTRTQGHRRARRPASTARCAAFAACDPGYQAVLTAGADGIDDMWSVRPAVLAPPAQGAVASGDNAAAWASGRGPSLVDQVGVAAIASALAGQLNSTKVAAANEQMIQHLGHSEHKQYERGLTTLGGLLGAEAFKPSGAGRCDSAWIRGSAPWVTVEAKSEQDGRKTLSLRDIRQANTAARPARTRPDDRVSAAEQPRSDHLRAAHGRS